MRAHAGHKLQILFNHNDRDALTFIDFPDSRSYLVND